MVRVISCFKAASATGKRPGMSKAYLEAIRRLPSCVSGHSPVQPHHLRMALERGVGMKATDRWAVPLTPAEHYNVHRIGSQLEAKWFAMRGIYCYALAFSLWQAWESNGEDSLRRAFTLQTGFPT
jgi:hypothetical protein